MLGRAKVLFKHRPAESETAHNFIQEVLKRDHAQHLPATVGDNGHTAPCLAVEPLAEWGLDDWVDSRASADVFRC